MITIERIKELSLLISGNEEKLFNIARIIYGQPKRKTRVKNVNGFLKEIREFTSYNEEMFQEEIVRILSERNILIGPIYLIKALEILSYMGSYH